MQKTSGGYLQLLRCSLHVVAGLLMTISSGISNELPHNSACFRRYSRVAWAVVYEAEVADKRARFDDAVLRAAGARFGDGGGGGGGGGVGGGVVAEL